MLVSYAGANPFTCEGVTLIPGQNKVKESEVKKMMRNPLFRHRVERGLVLMASPESFEPQTYVECTTQKEEQEKIKAIEESLTVSAVKKLIKNETSTAVIDAAQEKIEKIELTEKNLEKKFSPLKHSKLIEPNKDNGFQASAGVIS